MLWSAMYIEGTIYRLIKQSALGKAVKGKVYRASMRPNNARTEDIVVSFLTGNDDQMQTAVVNVNIYVPCVTDKNGNKVRDLKRIEELEDMVIQFINDDTSDFWIETDGTPTLDDVDGIDNTFINVRMRISRFAD